MKMITVPVIIVILEMIPKTFAIKLKELRIRAKAKIIQLC